MMEKVIPVGSWDFGLQPTSLIKAASTGVHGQDLRDLLVKRAADDEIARVLGQVKLARGDVPIHAIAIGATEAYGANRNGDGFNADTCRKQASTFVGRPLKDYSDGDHNGARLFYNHDNQHPPNSYGYVKAAAFNEKMKRIELLLVANGTKEAAERNGGHVMPDADQQTLNEGGLLPWSMACKVAFDSCSICDNKAPSRAHYCDSDSCVGADGFRGLGCKHGLAKIAANGRQQYVENPNALFFDFSRVHRPADRTAYGGLADYVKAAAAGVVIGGAELAEFYARQNGGEALNLSNRMKIARRLAAHEARLAANPSDCDRATGLAFRDSPHLPESWAKASRETRAAALSHAAENGVLLSPRQFLEACSPVLSNCGYDNEKTAAVNAFYFQLPGVYGRMVADGDAVSAVSPLDGLQLCPDSGRRLAKQASAAFVTPEQVSRLAVQAAARGDAVATLTHFGRDSRDFAGPAEELARRYALTKLAMLEIAERKLSPSQFDLLCRLAALQNYVY